ncbi:MAG: choice-of-anchor J domain-containing protein, partial [Muribaculaceae bacterium]
MLRLIGTLFAVVLSMSMTLAQGGIKGNTAQSKSYGVKSLFGDIASAKGQKAKELLVGNWGVDLTTANASVPTATYAAARASSDPIVPPYMNGFEGDDPLAGYTNISNYIQWQLINLYGDYYLYCLSSPYDSLDSWLITPAVQLESDKKYKVSFSVYCDPDFTERLEVYYGASASAEGMTKMVMAPTDIDWDEARTLSAEIMPAESGIYYIGIHGISDLGNGCICLDNLAISAGISINAPDSVTNLQVVADQAGATKARISFDAPTKTINGDALTSLTKIEVERENNDGKKLVKTIENPGLG